jgi:hypothetical protein
VHIHWARLPSTVALGIKFPALAFWGAHSSHRKVRMLLADGNKQKSQLQWLKQIGDYFSQIVSFKMDIYTQVHQVREIRAKVWVVLLAYFHSQKICRDSPSKHDAGNVISTQKYQVNFKLIRNVSIYPSICLLSIHPSVHPSIHLAS